jgi:DNA primase
MTSQATRLARVLVYYGFQVNPFCDKQKILCPFHGDENPSLLVDFTTGTWFCFGCNLSGDAFHFVELMEKQFHNTSGMKFAKIYKEAVNGKSRSLIKVDAKTVGVDDAYFSQLYDEAHDYYYCLGKTDWVHDDSDDISELREYMRSRGFMPSTLNTVRAKASYNRNYRLLFPMMDDGEFKGWVSRTTDKELAKKRKYLYNKGFRRRTTLVGNYSDYKFVYVVEGYMDWLKFRQFGLKNVVAILGWKMSKEQIAKLKDAGVANVVSALDNDKYGIQGTDYLHKFFKVKRFKFCKGVKDPGEMTKVQFKESIDKTLRSSNGHSGKH